MTMERDASMGQDGPAHLQTQPLNEEEKAFLASTAGGTGNVLAGVALTMGLVIGIVAWGTGGINKSTLLIIGGISMLVLIFVGGVLKKSDSDVSSDLAAGIKTVATGHVVDFYSDNSDDSHIYRLTFSIASQPPQKLKLFVPECVYQSVKRDDRVRIGFAPKSETLLHLETSAFGYVAGHQNTYADAATG